MSGKSKYKLEFIDGKPAKECSKCHVIKLLADYYPSKQRNFLGVNSRCIACFSKGYKKFYQINKQREILRATKFNLKSKYDLTKEDYTRLYEEQQGCCLICRDYFEKLVIDHCHFRNKFRGLLCTSCNAGLGQFKDNTILLEAAIEYLHRKGSKFIEPK